MKKAKLAVLPYRHHLKYKFVLDLRAFGKGRKFFKSRAEADAEAKRQRTLLEIHSREAVGLQAGEMSEIITARNKLAGFGKSIREAAEFFIDHLERVRRCKIT